MGSPNPFTLIGLCSSEATTSFSKDWVSWPMSMPSTLGMCLQPCRHIHHIADDRIVHAVCTAEITYGAVTGVNADSKLKRVLGAQFMPLGAKLAHAAQHRDGHPYASQSVFHDGITDIFI